LLEGCAKRVEETVRRLGFLQLDPIATVAPAAQLVLWSRLGSSYDPDELDRLVWKQRKFVEWDAFLYPAEDLPLLKALMRRRDRPVDRYQIAWLKENASFRRYVLKELERRGPLLSREIEDHASMRRRAHRWWGERKMGLMLGILNARGQVAVVGRKGRQRVWDLAERWYPETDTVSLREAKRLLLERRRRALGVWLERGRLHLHPEADDRPVPPRTTLVGPFDRLIHDRARAERLWDFRYRIEIYVPESKREYGYYVLPILHGDRLIGRLDPSHDKRAGVLRVKSVHAEPGAPAGAWTAVREALDDLARWVGAETVELPRLPKPWR
jgi:uncharacterized protein